MKKFLLLFVFAGLILSTSCKKESCPECEECPECPEIVYHAPGQWDAYKLFYNGQDLTNSGDPEVECYLNDAVTLNETQDGTSWAWTMYDSQSQQCEIDTITVASWAENWEKKFLYITIQYEYQGETHYYTKDAQFTNNDGTEFKITWGGMEIFYQKVQ